MRCKIALARCKKYPASRYQNGGVSLQEAAPPKSRRGDIILPWTNFTLSLKCFLFVLNLPSFNSQCLVKQRAFLCAAVLSLMGSASSSYHRSSKLSSQAPTRHRLSAFSLLCNCTLTSFFLRLTLESAGNDTSTILRTPGKSYTLRQKNTSNGILILRPQDDPNSLEQGLTTIATLHETVELDAIKEEVADKPVAKPKGKWHERFGSTR